MTLSADDIQKVVLCYEREHHRYVALADLVYERCLHLVEKAGLRATVQRRAKTSQSLRKKLLRMQHTAPSDLSLTDMDGVFRHVGDLAGVRVATYLESDRERVVQELGRCFDFVPATDDQPNPDSKNKSGYAKHYRAVHCQVLPKQDDLQGERAGLQGLSCEIQVCSMLAHVWNEIEHDLGYKPLTGPMGARELDSLEALGQLVRAGDIIIKTLLDANHERVTMSEARFGNELDFITRMQPLFPEATAFQLHATQLFHVLLELGLNRPGRIRAELLGAGDGYRARAQKLLEALGRHIQASGDAAITVAPESSDALAVLLFERKLPALLALYPRGTELDSMRLVTLARRFEAMRRET